MNATWPMIPMEGLARLSCRDPLGHLQIEVVAVVQLRSGILRSEQLSGTGTVLHHNPFWRNEPGQPGMLDHRVYALNAVGHLTAGAGLLCVFASVLVLISRVSSKNGCTGSWLLQVLRCGVRNTLGWPF
jgi:hypothetical protein